MITHCGSVMRLTPYGIMDLSRDWLTEWCLMVPSHYLNQSWLNIIRVQHCSPKGKALEMLIIVISKIHLKVTPLRSKDNLLYQCQICLSCSSFHPLPPQLSCVTMAVPATTITTASQTTATDAPVLTTSSRGLSLWTYAMMTSSNEWRIVSRTLEWVNIAINRPAVLMAIRAMSGNVEERGRNSWLWSLMTEAGGWFNIKMTSYQYRKSHCGDKTILRPSYLHNGISYTGKMTSLYWIRALVSRA